MAAVPGIGGGGDGEEEMAAREGSGEDARGEGRRVV